MKRIISAILCLVLLLGLATTAMAASPTVYSDIKVYFTSDSGFEAGDTVTVDEAAIMNDGDIQADVWNAILEGRVTYTWMRNDSEYATGKSLTLSSSDKGCRFYCQASVYADMAKTDLFGVFFSDDFFVPETGNPALIPEITTETLPNGTVGEEYYLRLECTDADVVFTLFRSSLPDGLYLTQHGEIEGTPTKAGFWYVVVMATPVELGEDYATTAEFEFYINEAGDYCELELMQEPDKLVYTSGETVDLTGMWVRIWTSEGYIDSYDGEGLTCPTNPLITVGDQKIKVSYGDACVIFLVVVEPAPTGDTTEATTEATIEATETATDPTDDVLTTGAQNSMPEEPTGVEPITPEDGDGYEGVPAPLPVFLWVLLALAALAVIAVCVVVVVLIVSKRKRG